MAWDVPGYRHRLDLHVEPGRVVLAQHESTGEFVVIRRVEAASIPLARAAVEDLSALSTDYFVRIREFTEDAGHAAIVTDAVNGATLRALIRDHGALGVEAALLLYRDTLAGLAYAHELDLVHGEISPENVLVDTDGRSLMTNAGAVRWRPRDATVTSGVYFAPERWREPPSTAADIYAATVVFVETLAGEPPYWEAADTGRLRQRHEEEDVPVAEVPRALHDVVRVGMAKDAEARLDAGPLLELVETVAIAEYGRDWRDRGRGLIAQRIELVALPLGSVEGIQMLPTQRDVEDVENDDYYRDAESSATSDGAAASVADGRDGDESAADAEPEPDTRDDHAEAVIAAAADIVELAQIRDAAEADAIIAASVEEELTDEEERAVAEIERLLALDSPASVDAPDVLPVTDETSPASEATPTSQTPSTNKAVPTIGATSASEAALASEASTDGAGPAEEPVSTVEAAAVVELSEASAGDGGGASTSPFYRRHPWSTAAAAAILVLASVGIGLWVSAGPSHPPGVPAAQASNQPTAVESIPVPTPSTSGGSAGGPVGPGSSPSAGGSPTAASSASPSVAPSVSSGPAPQPTLPVTGVLHPIRLMGAIAFGLVLLGAILVYAGRPRERARRDAGLSAMRD